jgi:hypothetical protein
MLTWQKLSVSVNCGINNHNSNPFLVGKQTAQALEVKLQPGFTNLICRFLHHQRHLDSDSDITDVPLDELPSFHEKISLYPSAVATFYAPSDISGVGGMRRERIRAVPTWRKAGSRYDCIFVNTDSNAPGMQGLEVARVRQFFSFNSGGVFYPCALVQWFSLVADEPDEDTGMWIVEPDFKFDGSRHMDIIHLDTIVRAAHLLGVCGDDFVPRYLSYNNSLDIFHSFYVNKFADHHAFEIAS